MCMYVCSYIFCICMYLCMYVCIIEGAPSTGFAFCVTPVMYMWLKLIIIKKIIIIKQYSRPILNFTKSMK